MKHFVTLLVVIIWLASCGGTKGLRGTKLRKMKADKIIEQYDKNSFDFNTLNAKLKVRYQGKKQSVSPSVTLRMKKGEKIWLSAKMLGITLAKILITPHQIAYYEKINNSYFEGDFTLVSKFLGTTLTFDQIEQLLIGKLIFNVNDEPYSSLVSTNMYLLKPKTELELFERLIAINPTDFTVNYQQIAQPKENRRARITYKEFQKISGRDFPKNIEIKAQDHSDITIITIDYKTVDYNANVSFPFSIPSGYEKVTIK